LIKSLRLSLYLTLFNLALSILVSKAYFGDLSLPSVTGLLGDFTLLVAMVLFLYGSAVDLSGTAKWVTLMHLLGLRKTDWKEGDSKNAERKAVSYITVGAILLVETVILALASV